MDKAKKERYEFKYPGYDSLCACNIYLFKADSVFYFGFEDINEGASLNHVIKDLCEYVIDKYKPDHENVFFFQWYTRYKNRGVEQIDFVWNKNKLETLNTKKFCEYKENPFH